MLCDRLGREILPGSVVMQVWSDRVFVICLDQVIGDFGLVDIQQLDRHLDTSMWILNCIRIDHTEWVKVTEVVGNVR